MLCGMVKCKKLLGKKATRGLDIGNNILLKLLCAKYVNNLSVHAFGINNAIISKILGLSKSIGVLKWYISLLYLKKNIIVCSVSAKLHIVNSAASI